MKYLKIKNKGLLDIRLVSLMGGTTKSNNKFKIGQFGTGLKYTLAYLIRNNIEFHIMIDGKEVDIKTETEIINNEEFVIVCIDGNRTSITTKMGYDWEPWMIVRELYSNALDEGGEDKEIVELVESEKGHTEFYLELTPDFMGIYNNWDKYFIVNHVPLYGCAAFDVHPNNGKMRLYKQGILIYESEQKSVFNYDIKYANINELREYTGHPDMDIEKCVTSLDEKSITYFMENISDDHFEGKMDYDWGNCFQERWKETLGNAKIIHPKALEAIKSREVDIDTTGMLTVPKKLYTALTKSFKGVGALMVADKVNEFLEIYDDKLDLKIKQCLTILESTGYFLDPELTFSYGVFGDETTLAQINKSDKTIFVSEKHLDKSLFDTCAMLIEENEHYRTGFNDCSRSFQQHFIDLYTKTLFDANEVKL